MKRQFAKLSKSEQEKIEREYHQMKPEEFERALSRAKKRVPAGGTTNRKSKTGEKKRAA